MDCIKVLLCVLLVLQIIVLLHMLYTSHKRYKQDTMFWDQMMKKEKKLYDDLMISTRCIAEVEEEPKSEQKDKDL